MLSSHHMIHEECQTCQVLTSGLKGQSRTMTTKIEGHFSWRNSLIMQTTWGPQSTVTKHFPFLVNHTNKTRDNLMTTLNKDDLVQTLRNAR